MHEVQEKSLNDAVDRPFLAVVNGVFISVIPSSTWKEKIIFLLFFFFFLLKSNWSIKVILFFFFNNF